MHQAWLSNFRRKLASSEPLLQFSLLGVISGVCCALVMLAFRFLIEWPSSLWLPGHNLENFQALPWFWHLLLPIAGALVLIAFLRKLPQTDSRVGVPHVIARLHAHQGYLPLKNALVQFFGGALCIASGQSGGREGPAIHLSAAVNSQLGQALHLPNNSIRLLAGCGTSAAIAASFDTPIAGVIFAMEVVMMEYSVAGFIPLMLAATTVTAVTRMVQDTDPLITASSFHMTSLWELPYIVLLGLVIGTAAALFIRVMKMGLKLADRPLSQRFLLAGVFTGCCALLVPEIMGIGYDSLSDAFNNQLSWNMLLALAALKLLATAYSSGLGMPIGLIGPNLLIGACIGGALGLLAETLFPAQTSHQSVYVMLGMGAMMGAVLNAPLAALMALLELTNNTNIIFPAMLAITVAILTNRELFKEQSAQQATLQFLKLIPRTDPVTLALQRISVASLMDRNISVTPRHLASDEARLLLENPQPNYICVDEQEHFLLKGDNLLSALNNVLSDNQRPHVDLLAICGHAQAIAELPIRATLREALDLMNDRRMDTLYISGYVSGPYPENGIINRSAIDDYCSQPQ